MRCDLIAVTKDGKGSIWSIVTRKNLDDALKVKLDGLADIAEVGDFIVLTATDKQALLRITDLTNGVETELVETNDYK